MTSVLWTQSLHILEKTRLYSAESVKFWHFPQSIGYFFMHQTMIQQ